jgi:hypothetical protein
MSLRFDDILPRTSRSPTVTAMIAAGLGMLLFLIIMGATVAPVAASDGTDPLSKAPDGQDRILGLVENGRLRAVFPAIGSPLGLRLTTIRRQEARSVESGEVDLTGYEGDAILVEGIRDSGWIYEARIIDHASPILNLLVRRAFEKKSP